MTAARPLMAVAGLVLVLVVLSRGSGPGPAPTPAPRLAPSLPPDPEPDAPSPVATRDVFRYADRRPPEIVRGRAPAPRPVPPPVELPLKLVGIVNKGGTRQAVLALSGEVTLAGVGGRLGGYTVLSIDEEAGVRLRDPAGQELTLPLPP